MVPSTWELLSAVPAAFRSGLRTLPRQGASALFTPSFLLVLAAAFVLGFLVTWWFAGVLSSQALPEAPALAASGLINLAVLGATLGFLPREEARAWGCARAWLRAAALAAAALAGMAAAPGSGASWFAAAALAALFAAQAGVLCGSGGALAWLLGRWRAATPLVLALLLSLAATSLFWSKPLLLPPYGKEHPEQRVVLARAVLCLGPWMNLCGAWNELGSGFDLVKGPLTYQVWIGSYYPHLAAYARLWPERVEDAEHPQARTLAPGLVVGLGMWALALVALSDGLGFIWQAARERGGRPETHTL